MMFVPVSQNTDLIILVLIEVKSIQFSVFKLQEIVIQRLLTDAHFLGRLLQGLAILIVEVAPFLHLLDDFAYLSLLCTSTALAVGLNLVLSGSHGRLDRLYLGAGPDLQSDTKGKLANC